MRITEIYETFMGEQNISGIGAPAIFVRVGGCHLRCYKTTKGMLCDTPASLDMKSGVEKSPEAIVAEVIKLSEESGIKLVCLTGGDPLTTDKKELEKFLAALSVSNIITSVETSGTLSIAPFRDIEHVFWVLDYKLPSAGITAEFQYKDLKILTENDVIKFVIDGEKDYSKFVEVLAEISPFTKAKLVAGSFWKGEFTDLKLFNKLKKDCLLGKVSFNMQVHKLVLAVNYSIVVDKIQL